MEWLLVPDGLVWVFQKQLINWDFHAQPSLGFTENGPKKIQISSERQLCGRKCLVDVRGQRRIGRLVRDDRKSTVTQITTRYNQGMQNTISECTTRWTLKQMDYSTRRPHRVPLLSANGTEVTIHTGSPKLDNRRLEKRCLVWWVSLLLLLTTSIPLWLQCTDILMATSTMSQSSNNLRLVSWTWQWVHFTQMASSITRSQSNRAPILPFYCICNQINTALVSIRDVLWKKNMIPK